MIQRKPKKQHVYNNFHLFIKIYSLSAAVNLSGRSLPIGFRSRSGWALISYAMTYQEQLQHPLWQKKRLEILERDNFACQRCGSKDKQLHVHHYCYSKGKKAWEAEDDSLTTFCKDCHFIDHLKDLTPLEADLIQYCITTGVLAAYIETDHIFMQCLNKIILKHKG